MAWAVKGTRGFVEISRHSGKKYGPVKNTLITGPHIGQVLLLVLDILIDGRGGVLARAHGQYDGGCAGDGVAAGIDALAAGQAVLALGDDAAVLVGLEARSGGAISIYN